MSRRMRALLAALAVLATLAAARGTAATRWFRSDELGLALEPVAALRADEFAWVLAVERVEAGGGWTETRRLLADGVERARWTVVAQPDGRSEEREERDGRLVARRLAGPAGELLQEERYEGGRLAARTVYDREEGRLVRVREFAADGKLASLVEYRTTPSGRLREVRRTGADGAVQSEGFVAGGTSAAVGGAAVAEERERDADGWRTTRYDEAGRPIAREQGGPAGLVSRVLSTYDPGSATPRSSTEEWPADRRLVTRTYDAAGAALTETTTVDGAVVERVAWTRDEAGRPLLMRRTGTGGTVEVRSSWNPDGTPAREEHFARGARTRTIVHTGPGERFEELYDEGAVFLRVYFRGDARVREEVILDGEVVRERTFGP